MPGPLQGKLGNVTAWAVPPCAVASRPGFKIKWRGIVSDRDSESDSLALVSNHDCIAGRCHGHRASRSR